MPRRLSRAEQDGFLRGRHVAVLVTIGPDGRPVPTPIWYLFRESLFTSAPQRTPSRQRTSVATHA